MVELSSYGVRDGLVGAAAHSATTVASCMWPLRNQPVPVYHRLGPTQSVQWHLRHPVRYEVGAFSLSSDRLYCEAAAPCSNVNLNVVHIA